ncbi:TolC family protein [Myroides pelagicus]|uniref:TolC family protein n=1 Tax=Myroides pelagicus TaxID=270914 RepID=UPI002DB983E1|nr:TolC family protein [Myroides pelagicus]MEC4114195.1 TolC family protein [Myroides pelagicus]
MKLKIYRPLLFTVIATATAISSWAQQPVDSLASYLQIALEQNPAIQAQYHAYEATEKQIDQAGAFQDPELSLGFYTKPMEIVGGRQIGDVTLMQMLPWFGTKKAAKTEANHMAQMKYQEYLQAKQTTILQVYTQWYVLQKLDQQLKNAEQNKSLLVQLEELALKRFSAPTVSAGSNTSSMTSNNASSTPAASSSSTAGMGGMSMGGSTTANQPAASTPSTSNTISGGSAMSSMTSSSSMGMSDVLRIRLEIIEIENTIQSLQASIKTEKVKFNALLNREANQEVTIDKTIRQVDYLMADDQAISEIENNNPMLGMIQEQSLAYKAKSAMDRKMSYPMLGVGVQYMILGKTNDPMLAMGDMNGKDMIMPMLTVSLPIFRKKYNAEQEEGKMWWKSSQQTMQNTLNNLKSEYYGYKNQLDDAQRTIQLYDKQTTLAQTTFNLIVKEFVAGKSDLTNVIQVQRQLLDYQLKKAEAIANYNTMVASINKLMAVGSQTQKQ